MTGAKEILCIIVQELKRKLFLLYFPIEDVLLLTKCLLMGDPINIYSVIASGYSQVDYKNILTPELIKPIKSLRSWAFIFCFLSIGLTTRFRELAAAGKKPFWAFTIGVIVNATIGFILSVLVLGDFWIEKTMQ